MIVLVVGAVVIDLVVDQLVVGQVAVRRRVDVVAGSTEAIVGAAGKAVVSTPVIGGRKPIIATVIARKPATTTNPYTGTVTTPPKQNPWIRYVQTGTQGFATVKVTPAMVQAKFHHTMPLKKMAGSATTPSVEEVVTLVKTVTVNKDSTALTIS